MLRRIAFATFLVLLLPAIAAVLLLRDGDRPLALLQWLVEQRTPYTLEMRSASLSWSPLSLRAQLILLHDPRRAGPPLVSVQNPDLSVPLRQLVLGRGNKGHLTATNVSYYLESDEQSDPIDLQELVAPLTRLPQRVEVASVHLIAGTDNLWIFPLLNTRAERDDSGSVNINALAHIGQRSVALAARTRWTTDVDAGLRMYLDSSLGDASTSSMLDLSGEIHTLGPTLSYSFAIEGSYARISDFVRALDSEAYPFTGDLHLAGQLSGNLDGYRLALDEVTLTTPEDYRFTASGDVASSAGAVAISLNATGEAERLDALIPLPAPLSRHLSRSAVDLTLTGTLDAPVVSRAELLLAGAGETTLRLRADGQNLPLGALRGLADPSRFEGQFTLESADLSAFTDMELGLKHLSAAGTLLMTDTELRLNADQLSAALPAHQAEGSGRLLWRNDILSAPQIDLMLTDRDGGSVKAAGTIADVSAMAGIALQVSSDESRLYHLADSVSLASRLPDGTQRWLLSGSAQILSPGKLTLLRDADLSLRLNDGVDLSVRGDGQVNADGVEADLTLQLMASSPEALRETFDLPVSPRAAEGRLRLRPAYATLLAEVQLPQSTLQATVTGTLTQAALERLDADIYTPHLTIDDLLSYDKPDDDPAPFSLKGVGDLLPPFPTRLSLRADRLTGPMSELNHVHIATELRDQRILLRKFDAGYDGGELLLRGVADLNLTPPALSLAGRGIRVPLGTLTRDFQLQQTVDGAVSLRTGLSTRGDTVQEWQQQLGGSLALALSDTTVSGAAYDLLMSNLLAWLVKGAGEKTSTFDCTMARFDFAQGVGRSDSLYLETPRMLATGKGNIDLNEGTLDLRLEPRSKTRTFQFPSAVRIRGELSDPGVSVSPLQTTADLSAQALLLLPSLALKLFGVRALDEQLLPCSVPEP